MEDREDRVERRDRVKRDVSSSSESGYMSLLSVNSKKSSLQESEDPLKMIDKTFSDLKLVSQDVGLEYKKVKPTVGVTTESVPLNKQEGERGNDETAQPNYCLVINNSNKIFCNQFLL